MRNSETKINLMRAIVFIALFILINQFLLWALNDDISMRTNIYRCLHNQYEDVFIGTSQCRAAIDPGIVETQTGRNATNCSIPLSSPMDQYFLVKAMCGSGNKPERIIYECDPYYFSDAKSGGHSYAYPIGKVRLEYVWAGLEQDWRIALCHWAFHTGNYFRMFEILGNKINYLENGPSMEYSGYQPVDGNFTEKTLVDRDFSATESAEKYIRKLTEYCNDQEIELVICYLPVSEKVYEELEPGYRKGADDYFKEISSKYGIRYINCNEWNQQGSWESIENYIDMEGHMKKDTSKEFSEKLGKVLYDMELKDEIK